jgi:hypothetical protein
MIELYLSSDGKHTVHVTAETPEEMATLVSEAKALYQEVLRTYGTKAQMWSDAKQSNGNEWPRHGREAHRHGAGSPCRICAGVSHPPESDGVAQWQARSILVLPHAVHERRVVSGHPGSDQSAIHAAQRCLSVNAQRATSNQA